MIASGFIENFFFISLALVFVLVLLLVYHFKNRITVAEKKSDSMYGLLTAVVKEIKTLRGMFGLGGVSGPVTGEPEPPSIEVKSKTTPEVNVGVLSCNDSHGTVQNGSANIPPTGNSNKFAAFLENAGAEEPREVITLEFSASDNKIVVSDVDDSDEESESDSDEESISDDESTVSEKEEDDAKECTLDVQEIDLNNEPSVSELNDETVVSEHVQEVDISNILSGVNSDEIEVNLVEAKPEIDNTLPQLPSIEQLRKMNINQLKTIASQHGISTDISKMKKHELISLIRGGVDA